MHAPCVLPGQRFLLFGHVPEASNIRIALGLNDTVWQQSLQLYQSVAQMALAEHCGYPIAWDAGHWFAAIFESARAAVAAAVALQQQLLGAAWPSALLSVEQAGVVVQDMATPGQPLFRGLRVALAIYAARGLHVDWAPDAAGYGVAGPEAEAAYRLAQLAPGGSTLVAEAAAAAVATAAHVLNQSTAIATDHLRLGVWGAAPLDFVTQEQISSVWPVGLEGRTCRASQPLLDPADVLQRARFPPPGWWRARAPVLPPDPAQPCAIVVASVEGLARLQEGKLALPAPALAAALAGYAHAVRRHAARNGGYVCDAATDGARLVVAFGCARAALRAALHLQLDLLSGPWPPELLAHPSAGTEHARTGAVLFRGLAACVGLHWGLCAYQLSRATHRMRYAGPAVDVAAVLCRVAPRGAVLLTDAARAALDGAELHDLLVDPELEVDEPPVLRAAGPLALPPSFVLPQALSLYSAYPHSLRCRAADPPAPLASPEQQLPTAAAVETEAEVEARAVAEVRWGVRPLVCRPCAREAVGISGE